MMVLPWKGIMIQNILNMKNEGLHFFNVPLQVYMHICIYKHIHLGMYLCIYVYTRMHFMFGCLDAADNSRQPSLLGAWPWAATVQDPCHTSYSPGFEPRFELGLNLGSKSGFEPGLNLG